MSSKSEEREIQEGGCFSFETAEMSIEEKTTKLSMTSVKQKSFVTSAKVLLKPHWSGLIKST